MKYRKILSVTFLIFSISFWGIAEDNDSNQDIKTELYGIDSLELVIENLDKDAKALGLNEEKIKTKTELKLRREGIEILEKYQSPPKIGTKEWKDWKDQIHQPYIYKH